MKLQKKGHAKHRGLHGYTTRLVIVAVSLQVIVQWFQTAVIVVHGREMLTVLSNVNRFTWLFIDLYM